MEKTADIYIDNTEEKAKEALEVIDGFIKSQDMDRKSAIRLRLMAEETIGMIRAMAGDFKAVLRMEKKDGEYRVCLTAKTDMDKNKKSSLLSVSSSGKNAAAKGFMGKIGEIIENGLLNFDDVMRLQQEYCGDYVDYAMMGFGLPDEYPALGEQLVWSLSSYKESLGNYSDDDEPAKEAWDELEKSIVASIAKDVIVGVKKDNVEMTIIG
ncbi:MAG: hypothetical protein K5888_06905 [Lachnospiraceae bacterium]|nr:hypothetical protein [Lachnospiraceae bacterium]